MERPKTSQKVIDLISYLVDAQDQKGLMKYGKSIDDACEYDWNVMALEEMVDGMKYMVKENEYLNKRLREFNKKTWFPVYEENLRLAEDVKKWHNHSVELSEQVYVLLKENEELKDKDFKRIGVSPEYYQELEEDNKMMHNQIIEMSKENKQSKQKYENLKMILTGFVEKYGRLK